MDIPSVAMDTQSPWTFHLCDGSGISSVNRLQQLMQFYRQLLVVGLHSIPTQCAFTFLEVFFFFFNGPIVGLRGFSELLQPIVMDACWFLLAVNH